MFKKDSEESNYFNGEMLELRRWRKEKRFLYFLRLELSDFFKLVSFKFSFPLSKKVNRVVSRSLTRHYSNNSMKK